VPDGVSGPEGAEGDDPHALLHTQATMVVMMMPADDERSIPDQSARDAPTLSAHADRMQRGIRIPPARALGLSDGYAPP
jgi:hypothetical protein